MSTDKELNNELLLLASKEDELKEYTQFEIYLTYPEEKEAIEPMMGLSRRAQEYKDPVQEFINREFRELNFSSRNIFGTWHGVKEHSVVITHLVDSDFTKPVLDNFKEIAKKFKEEFNQETVLITVTFIRAAFV